MLIIFCFCLGDVETALATPTGYPFMQVFSDVTHSNAGTTVMTSVLIIMNAGGCITNIATSSRQMWAFARDRGKNIPPSLAFSENPRLLLSYLGINPDSTTKQTCRSPLQRLAQLRKTHLRHKYPPQRRDNILHHHNPPIPNQHLQHRRLQRSSLPRRRRLNIQLHNLHLLRGVEEVARGTHAAE